VSSSIKHDTCPLNPPPLSASVCVWAVRTPRKGTARWGGQWRRLRGAAAGSERLCESGIIVSAVWKLVDAGVTVVSMRISADSRTAGCRHQPGRCSDRVDRACMCSRCAHKTAATAGPARPRTLRSARWQQRQAAPQHSPWFGSAHRRVKTLQRPDFGISRNKATV
jgi:hypothetical protein